MNWHEHIQAAFFPASAVLHVIKEWFNAWELAAEIHEAVKRLTMKQRAASKSEPTVKRGVAASGSCVQSRRGSSKHYLGPLRF